MTDTESYVAKSFTPQADTWYMVSWGAYPSPTTTEPFQVTLWMQVNAGSRATQTITYDSAPDVGSLIVGPYMGNAGYYLDQLGVWSWPWSTGNVTSMYNSGSGREYPFTF